MWEINAEQQIYRHDPESGGWDYIPGALLKIAVGDDGAVWGVKDGNAGYQFIAKPQMWTWVPGTLLQVAVGSSNSVWGVNPEGAAYHFNPQTRTWQYAPGVTTSGQIFEFDAETGTWAQMQGSLDQVVVGADAAVWGLKDGSALYYR